MEQIINADNSRAHHGQSDLSLEERLSRIEQGLESQMNILHRVRKDLEKTRRYILVGRVMSLVYLLIIILPIILAAIYLPPYVREFADMFSAIPESGSNGSTLREMQQLLKELKNGY